MSIRVKTALLTWGIFLVVVLVVAPYAVSRIRKLAEHSYEHTVEALEREVELAMAAKKDVWLTNALQLAKNPVIVESIRTGARDPAIALLADYGAAFSESTNFRNVRVHVIDAELNSFVKSWDAAAFGESLFYSQAYRYVRATLAPTVTMEPASNGLRLKGLFPISIDGEFSGVVNFEGGLNSIKRDLKSQGVDFLYLMHEEYLDIAASLQDAPRVGPYAVSQKDVDEPFLAYCVDALDLAAARERFTVDDDYLVSVIPIYHIDEAEVGIFIVGQQTTLATELLKENRRFFLVVFIVLGSVIVLLVVLQSFFLEYSVVRPVRDFSGTFEEIAGGRLDTNIDVGPRSYLGSLAAASGDMVEKIRAFVLAVQRTAISNEESQRRLEQELEQTLAESNSISYSTSTTTRDMRHLSELVDNATAAVGQINTSIGSLSNRIDDQSSAVTETTAAVEEMSASVKSIAQIAQERAESSEQLVVLTGEGAELVHQTVSVIDEVGQRIGEMLELVDVINTVTEQTNLLAMNAAIEAAHAGEHGRGFAVVADEIRKLAESTKESSSRISSTLNTLTQRIRVAVTASRDTGNAFARIDDGTRAMAESFQGISASTAELDAGSTEMVNAAEQMMQIANDVQGATNDIRAAMGEISTLVRSVDSTSDEVGRQVYEIRGGVAKINASMGQIARSSIDNTASLQGFMEEIRSFTVSVEAQEAQSRAVARIRLSQLILAHALWVTRARGFIDGTTELDPTSLVDHTTCDLGTWMGTDESVQLLGAATHRAVDDEHRGLHRVVSQIVAGAGDRDEEATEKLFQQLVSHSVAVVEALGEVRSTV